MPYKSKSQVRAFFAKEERGELPKGTAKEWAHKTPDIKKLPEHVKKSSAQIADEVLAKLGANLAKGIGVFSAGKGGPKALERVMHRESPMQHKPATPQSQPIEWRKSIGEKPKGESEMLKFFSLKEAAIDPEVMEAAALKSSAGGGASKLWQGLTGLSDDVLMAGMNIKQKMDRTKQREKHAAEQVVSSLSMLVKMSDVAKKEKLQGGKADGKSVNEYDSHQVAMGEKVEREHTDDPALAAEISTDHLEEIPDYYSRLKKMEDAAPKKEAQEGMLTEQPVSATSPMSLSPDIIQLLRAQMLVDQAKMAAPNDPGDIQRPYQRERENGGQEPEALGQEQAMRQAQYEHQLAEQMRAQKVEHEYTGKVRRGELAGALGGMGAGAGLGYLLGKPGSRFAPMAVGGALTGLLGKGLGRHVGQQQGLDYLKEYSGTPWAVQ